MPHLAQIIPPANCHPIALVAPDCQAVSLSWDPLLPSGVSLFFLLCVFSFFCFEPPARSSAAHVPRPNDLPLAGPSPLHTCCPKRNALYSPPRIWYGIPFCELPTAAAPARRLRRPALRSTAVDHPPALFFSQSQHCTPHSLPPVNSCVALISEPPAPLPRMSRTPPQINHIQLPQAQTPSAMCACCHCTRYADAQSCKHAPCSWQHSGLLVYTRESRDESRRGTLRRFGFKIAWPLIA